MTDTQLYTYEPKGMCLVVKSKIDGFITVLTSVEINESDDANTNDYGISKQLVYNSESLRKKIKKQHSDFKDEQLEL